MAKISVIVPVYKVEKLIGRCIESLINQTYKDLEIILVEDKSPDKSGQICDEYAKKDSRIKVIHKEKNSGVCDTRNVGLKAVTGEYIGFVDSDDCVETDMFEFLYNNLINNDADISTCATTFIRNNKTIVNSGTFNKLCEPEEAIYNSFYGPASSLHVGNKLYKKEIFDKIQFDVTTLYEDAFILPRIFMMCKKIYMSSTPKYKYFFTISESITNTTFKDYQMDMVRVFIKNKDYVCKVYPNLAEVFDYRITLAAINTFKKLILVDNYKETEYYSYLVNLISSYYDLIFKSKYFNKKSKLLMFLFRYFRPLYIKLIRSKNL